MAEPEIADPKPVPSGGAAGSRTTWALGSLAVFLFALEALTGLGLLFHYRPSVEAAFHDVVDLREASGFGFGWKLHHWGSHALVAVVLLHLLRVAGSGAYRPPRHRNWTAGVALLVLTLLLAATGAVLPWDAAAHAWLDLGLPASPGSGLPSPGGPILRRSFALHVGLLPAAALGLIVYHLRRARRDGGDG
jgi:quinol-cytochrome oxidoreductase complex cytochrome b subunit